MGGLVLDGSVQRDTDSLKVGFRLTDMAQEVLAKHDENYMPPEVADSLKKAGK